MCIESQIQAYLDEKLDIYLETGAWHGVRQTNNLEEENEDE